MRFKLIYADPPWLYDDTRSSSSMGMARSAYECMPLEEVKALPVADLADPEGCMLALWVTMPKLPEALQVIEAWGFRYITCGFVWVKLNPGFVPVYFQGRNHLAFSDIYSGLGHWVNGNAELCLLGRVGRPIRMVKDVKQVIVAPRGAHSAKPPEARERLEKLFGDVPRLELFAREEVDGWHCAGEAIDGVDISTSIGVLRGAGGAP